MKKLIAILLFISLFGSVTLYAADTQTDYTATKSKVLQVQNENNNLPTNLPVDERKGAIGFIISKLFDNNGQIGNVFIKAIGAITSGYVPRWNGSSFVNGQIRDNGTNVGIGGTPNSYKLSVAGDINFTGDLRQNGAIFNPGGKFQDSITPGKIYYNGGNIGIGVTNPQAVLHVESGNTDASYTSVNHGITVGNQTGLNLAIDGNEILARDNGGKANLHLQLNGGDLTVHDTQAGGSQFIIKDGGNVGIGTSNPGHKLEVAGNMELNGYAAIGPNAQEPSDNIGLTIGTLAAGDHDRNTYQTYINQTIPTTVLTANRTSFGNYTRLINNKGGTNTWGERSTAYGGYTWVETTGSNFARFNVGGLFETRATTLSGAQDIRGVQAIVRQNDQTGDSTVVAAYGLEALAYGETNAAGDSKMSRARGVSALTYAYETDIGTADGIFAEVRTTNGDGGDIFTARGVTGYAIQDSAVGGDITNGYGGAFHTYARAGGPLIPIAVGVQGRADDGVNAYGGRFYAEDAASANNYGVYVAARNGTNNNWAVYAPYSDNYFGGNIGAGITKPTSRLSVLGSGGGFAVRESDNDRDGFTVTSDANNSYLSLKDGTSTSVYLTTTNSDNWITAAGGLGIGTSTPNEQLSVAGRISLTADPNSGDDVGNRDYNDARYLAIGSGASVSNATTGAAGIIQIAGDIQGTWNNITLKGGVVDSANILDNSIRSVDIENESIMNADINSSAAIAGTKISPNFGGQNITLNGSDIDFTRGDTGGIHSIGTISFDWTAGTYDLPSFHGIESKDELGALGDKIRINSYSDIINTIDSNVNSTSYFKVQKESSTDGIDLFVIDEAGNTKTIGNVGIGVSSSSSFKTSIQGNDPGTGVFQGLRIAAASPTGSTSNDYIILAEEYNGGNRFWVRGDGSAYHAGNVGIGVTGPSQKLEVDGNVLATAYFHSSDKRLKKNIKTISGLDIISQLRGVRYDWKKDGEASVGVIAQELEEILPSAVKTGTDGMKSVDYDQLIAPLIEAVKELQIQNKELLKQIKQLQK